MDSYDSHGICIRDYLSHGYGAGCMFNSAVNWDCF